MPVTRSMLMAHSVGSAFLKRQPPRRNAMDSGAITPQRPKHSRRIKDSMAVISSQDLFLLMAA